MRVITGGGAFTFRNITDLNNNFAELGGVDLWVRPQVGSDSGSDGTYDNAFRTMSGLTSAGKLVTGVTIGLEGVLTEEFTTPLGVNNVTIVGDQVTPRQATTSGVPNGGGATWLSPSSGTGTLLKVRGQGWTVANIYFNNSATAAACVQVLTDGAGDPPVDADGAHFLLKHCILTGTDDGLNANGGTNFITVDGCTFFGFSGSGDMAISTTAGAGVGTLLGWVITNCTFRSNASHIVAALSHARILNNTFDTASASVINLTGGVAPNFVVGNRFNIAAANFDPDGGVTGVTGDCWSNTLTDAIETGLPAN